MASVGCGPKIAGGNGMPSPTDGLEAFGTVDVPEAMSSQINHLIGRAEMGHYSLSKFELELRRELGTIYYKKKDMPAHLDISLLERSGWKGDYIYEYGLDADMACYVFVRNDVVVGGIKSP